MIILLYGEDSHRLQRKLKEIENGYRKVHASALDLQKFDASEISFRGFLDAMSQQSMFTAKKLFFLENVFSNEDFKKEFSKNIEQLSVSQHILALIEKAKLQKTTKLFRALQRTALCQEFEPLSGLKLANWVKKEIASYGAGIEPFALRCLMNFVGSDLWRMSQEIKKLASYTKRITEKDVALFVKPRISAEIFKTIESLAQGDKKGALRMLQSHLDKGDSPFYLLKMFVYQFRSLLLVKSGQKTGMQPFVFRKTMALSHRFSLKELKSAYQKIFQQDINIKTGRINPEDGLKMLIAHI